MSRFRDDLDDPWGQDRRVSLEERLYVREMTPGADEHHLQRQPVEVSDEEDGEA